MIWNATFIIDRLLVHAEVYLYFIDFSPNSITSTILIIITFKYIFLLVTPCSLWIFVPQPVIEPGPWQWKHWVLTTGLPKNFLKYILIPGVEHVFFPLDLKFLNNIIMVWFLHSKLHDFRCTIWWVLVDVYIPVKPPLQSTYLRLPSLPKMSLHPFVIHLSLHSCP